MEWFKQLAEEGIILDPLRKMPLLYTDLSISYEAFWTLSSSRPVGFGGLGLIPFSEIAAYLNFRRIKDPDMQDEIIDNVRYLDKIYLEELDKMKKKKEGNKDGD